MKPISMYSFLSGEWKHTATIATEIEKTIGMKLTLPQVRRSMLAFPRVIHDPEKDTLRIVSDPDTNQ